MLLAIKWDQPSFSYYRGNIFDEHNGMGEIEPYGLRKLHNGCPKGFSMKQGVAIVPEKNWNEMTEEETAKAFSGPKPEKAITRELRQKEFDNYTTTDDHGMHIVGLATDQAGNTFYKVKNSWGVMGKYDGFIYVSRAYIMLRTTNCMVNKSAIPSSIAKKLAIS